MGLRGMQRGWGVCNGAGGTQRGWGVRNGAGGYVTGQLHTTGQGQGVWWHATGCDGVVAHNRVGGGGYGWGVRGALGYATGARAVARYGAERTLQGGGAQQGGGAHIQMYIHAGQ